MKNFNFTNRCLTKEQELAFINGYEVKIKEIESVGWSAARDSFNLANNSIKVYSNLGYAFSCGEMEALLDTKQNFTTVLL